MTSIARSQKYGKQFHNHVHPPVAQMEFMVGKVVYRAENITHSKSLEILVGLSDDETEVTTRSIVEKDCITDYLQGAIDDNSENAHRQVKNKLSILLMQLEAWWDAFCVQELQNTIEQWVIHFGYPKMPLVSNIAESIGRMGLGDNFTTDISEHLHIGNVKENYSGSDKVTFIEQMIKHNDKCSGLDYIQETLSYFAL